MIMIDVEYTQIATAGTGAAAAAVGQASIKLNFCRVLKSASIPPPYHTHIHAAQNVL